MEKIKVAFFDVDGTVVNNNLDHYKHSEMELVPHSTIEAIQKLKAKGITSFIATGRSPFMIQDLLKGLEIESFICTNGQYAQMNGCVMHEHPYSEQLLDRIVKVATENKIPLLWMPADHYILSGENQELLLTALDNMRLPVPIIQTDLKKAPTKIYQMVAGITPEQEHLFAHLDEIRILRWQPTGVDILPKEGSKASAIEIILEKLNLKPENAIAFGDGLNDIEMLKTVGMGVAMGNAHEETKKHADFVTKAVHEDGIHYALTQLGLIE